MSPAHQSGRRRYAERAAAETATSTPAVGHQRASDKRIQMSAAEADALIARDATPTDLLDVIRKMLDASVRGDHRGERAIGLAAIRNATGATP